MTPDHAQIHPPSTCPVCAMTSGVDGYTAEELRLFALERALAQVEREHADAVGRGLPSPLSPETVGLVRRLLGVPR